MEIFPLTEASCLEILGNTGIDISNSKVKVMKYKFHLSDTLLNKWSSYGDIFRLRIEYEKDSHIPGHLTVLVKSPISSPKYMLHRDTGVYENEYILYSQIFAAMLNLNADASFAPLFYGGNAGLPAIVTEDLYSKGFTTMEKSLSHLDYKAVFRCMAKMHALSVILNRKTPIADKLKPEGWNARDLYSRGVNQLVARLSARTKEMYPELVKVFRDTAADKIIATNENAFKALIHGNLWYPNILRKLSIQSTENDSIGQRVAFMNFENARWDNVTFDIWYFVVSNAPFYVIAHHLEPLLEIYADTMNRIFESYHVDTYDVVYLKKNVYENCLYALYVCGVMAPIFDAVDENEFCPSEPVNGFRYKEEDLCSEWFSYFAKRGFLEKRMSTSVKR